ncbi:hypothetical protein BH10CYA1_BH10CYA1_49080 [soil metagenome]
MFEVLSGVNIDIWAHQARLSKIKMNAVACQELGLSRRI